MSGTRYESLAYCSEAEIRQLTGMWVEWESNGNLGVILRPRLVNDVHVYVSVYFPVDGSSGLVKREELRLRRDLTRAWRADGWPVEGER